MDRQDRYGRTLAYVWTDQDTLINQSMISEGFAHEYTYNNTTYKYQAPFNAGQQAASQEQLGLWSPDTCNGNTNQPAP